MCGSEIVSRWAPGRRLFNAYGPTETTVCATLGECWVDERRPPIGRALANMKVYILGEGLQPSPVGVAGEIYIGGVGLARGYHGRPGLTADRFIPHSFSDAPGSRLYRTGDLARYLASGAIDYLGRLDHQVKLRGHRIEPAEIESTLRQHEAVGEAVVILHEKASGGKRLVAYVTLAQQPLRPVNIDRRRLYQLPNKIRVADLNRNETDLIYEEIFVERSYLRHGVRLRDGDCVFDVGANIGLFTLFVHDSYRDAQVYAFEPLPPIFNVLDSNVRLHGLRMEVFNLGLSDSSGSAAMTFYPRATAMSGAYANVEEDEETIRAFLENQDAGLKPYADELLAGRFESQTFICQLKTLSEVIRENGVE
ncbi:MAG: FkbM family methyltransferase, partial [Blastocatellia bacterium]